MQRRYLIVLVAIFGVAVASVFAKPKAQDDKSKNPSAANDARYTLYCRAIAGPDHVARAASIKDQLLQLNSSLRDWYVIHEDDQSVIYYGHYRAIDDSQDKAESERAQKDRVAVQKLVDKEGDQVFAKAIFVELATPDPTARPEWDLRNAKGFWSVEIAVYKDSPQRKQAAVDTVVEARKRGEEAYYYHGPTASSVCIGAWPRDAVLEQQPDNEVFNDPTRDILVLPGVVDVPHLEVKNRAGEPVTTIAPRVDIVDPSLQATLKKYPSRALNGEDYLLTVTDEKTHEQKQERQPSVLVQIPQQQPSILRASDAPPTLVAPVSPSQTPGAGTLKSIGQ